jgi:uncharacterized protein YyaL (SSP411 family)
MNRGIYLLSVALAAVLLLSACQPSVAPAPPVLSPALSEVEGEAEVTETGERPADAPQNAATATVPTPVFPVLSGAEVTASGPSSPTPDESLPSDEAEGIHWYDWEPATFALAQAENKPILLDLTAVWCHWCHVMDETSYSDLTVIGLVNTLYIPIRVDTDQRPDVQARYLMGGWPTTAFLTPQGDILTGGTYTPPGELIPLLQRVSEYYTANEADIAARVAELRQQEAAARPQPATGIPTDTLHLALDGLEATYDPTYGGFGQQPKFPAPGAVALIFRYDYTADDAAWRERALHTLEGVGHLVDPVWGGVYRYSVTSDWQTPHYEKLLSSNAQVLRNYLEAYQACPEPCPEGSRRATGDTAYRTKAEAILGYVERFLWDPAGGFYGSQDADLVQPGSHEILVDGEEYFLLVEKERLALGIPYVDTTFYTNWNGQMIVAMLEAAAVLEQPRYQEMALLALDRLWEQGRGPDGQMWHNLQAGEGFSGNLVTHPPATLTDQAHFGLALLAAYSATGQRERLSQAEELAGYVLAELSDPVRGGFYDLPADPDASGALSLRETPCQDNVVAASFFTRLYRMTGQAAYHDAAEGALRLCAASMAAHPDYALAADDLLTYPLILAVVGTPGEGATDALLAAANRFYAPGKVVIPLDPALGPPALGDFAYPADRVAIYACHERRCSLPVEDPVDLAEQVSWLMTES